MSHLFPTYSKWEIEPESAQGSYLYSKNGGVYLDFTSGIGVCNLGHCHPEVKAAVEHQLNKFWHVSNLFPLAVQEKAAEILTNASGLDLVFFANSGAEANEAAIKLARKATGKTKILTFKQSFHGRTFATMSATGQDKIKQGYGPMLETFEYVPFNDLNALKEQLTEDVAAVMLEVVQGEGGIYVASQEFLQGVEALCKEKGVLLLIDEIQTGMGRTGKAFAFQHFGIKPDIISVAKGMANGIPTGAIVADGKLKEFFGPGSHGTTFGGNPLAMAAAIKTMEIIFEPAFLEAVEKKSEWVFSLLKEKLAGNQHVKDIRGLGLMIGIELDIPVASILGELRKEGLIVLNAGEKVIRLLPSLNTSPEDFIKGMEIMQKSLNIHAKVTI
ncbi:acetylornithine aminotransferase [Niallia circulans]|jgi:acetylornithine/N-succinyldiaminopimelate aminotransferase|uniref:Acetylornithine aminotransferase n=1 Tax=Niallia circulans TaxID=1397 RepID=A0A0J1IJW0_NIACI|nr:acetylornithine transaminase [Niallia circulans]KLV26187.1 acetylornithine aminotransferase [Niallia circulans]MDR4316062.1 acetylornithine transaminase [Niallia circulans]MED3837599.1 acetylornithine transaminase [Niallia circulans]MED4244669.1 acetylornithine transaminase [Niallia circulans]MED4249847.1 acetylornithine transaminase [Niallia circulans]